MHMCLYLNTGSLKNVHTEIKPKAFLMLRQPSSTELHLFNAKEASKLQALLITNTGRLLLLLSYKSILTPTCAKVSLIVQFSPWPY